MRYFLWFKNIFSLSRTIPKIEICLSLPKQSQKSRLVLQGRSRFFGIVLEGETHLIAEIHKTDIDTVKLQWL